jgi:SAM-dependent methyltransferase
MPPSGRHRVGIVPPQMDLNEVSGASHRRHPWEVARARFFRRVLHDAGVLGERRTVLDVGAGDGYLASQLLEELPPGSEVTCLDPNYKDADLAAYAQVARPGISFTRELPNRRADILLMLDVIEHVPDDHEFLGGLVAQCLAPGGSVLVSVPAWQALFSAHDVALKHYRRYSPGACHELLEDEGLVIVRSGELFHSLLVPRALSLARERLMGLMGRPVAPPSNLGDWRGGALLTAALGGALAVDNALTHWLTRSGFELPGLSVWALCRVRDKAPV